MRDMSTIRIKTKIDFGKVIRAAGEYENAYASLYREKHIRVHNVFLAAVIIF